MNVHTDSVLRSLDAASATMTADEHQRANVALDRILSTSPSVGGSQASAVTPGRRTSRRLILIPAAAVALAVGSVVIPGLGGQGAAYASWSATPTAVAARDLDAVKAACRQELPDYENAAAWQLVLAERRGDFVTLLYRTDNPDVSVPCVARNPQGTTDVSDVDMAVGGSSGPALKAPAKGYTQGTVAQFGGSETASVTDGAVGYEVLGVTIHAGSLTVTATVRNGRYAAWWPGVAFEDGPAQPSGRGGPQLILTYDLTLTDGTVIRNAQPSRPS